MKMKFFKPNIGELEKRGVLMAMDGEHLSDGSVVGAFEDAFMARWGYSNLVAMNSGTSCLYSTLMALGVGPGDEVLVTPYTFIASVHVAMLVGATPVFVDIDRSTYNMCPQDAARKVTLKTKACIPVDIFGVPAQVDILRKMLPDSVYIVQDAIEALGSTMDGQYMGKFADAVVYGFSPNKQMTTCEGGVVSTKDPLLSEEIRRIRQHGVKSGDPHYLRMGHNFRMTDVHAAIGLAQLGRFDDLQHGVREAESKLDEYFLARRKQFVPPHCTSTLFVYVIELPDCVDKQEFITAMAGKGIPIKPYFNNLAEYPHLREYGRCPVASEVGSKTVALPTPHDLTDEQAELIYTSYMEVIYEDVDCLSASR